MHARVSGRGDADVSTGKGAGVSAAAVADVGGVGVVADVEAKG